MKQIVEVRANIYANDINLKNMKTSPFIELVLIHSDGKKYRINDNDEIEVETEITDTRFIMNPFQLNGIIDQLQNWQKTLNNRKDFWDHILPGIEQQEENPEAGRNEGENGN